MVTTNPESSSGSSKVAASQGTLTFGDFATQDCGAWAMGLINTQNQIEKMGSKIAQNFTEQQKDSYHGQSEFLINGLAQSYSSADEQKSQMMLEAASSFVSAGATLGVGVLPMAHKGMDFDAPYLRRLNSKAAGRLNNLNDKLAQQEKLLELAHKPAVAHSVLVGPNPNQPNLTTTDGQLTLNRKEELIKNGGGQARELSSAQVTGTQSGSVAQSEQEAFGRQQKGYDQTNKTYDFDRSKGQYYRETVDQNSQPEEHKYQQTQVSKGTRTMGAYHFDKLDESAIGDMDQNQKDAFTKKLEDQIKTTKTEINTATVEMSTFQQTLTQMVDLLKNGSSGSFQVGQASCAANAKKDEAGATIRNQEAGIAGGVTQSIASAKAGVLDSVSKDMGAFSGAFQAMRG